MLQFKRAESSLSYAERKKERALLAAHGQSWLGELAEAIEEPIFRKGFLSECTVRSGLDPHLMKSPQWATVRRVAGGPDIIHAPGLSSLEVIGPIKTEVLTLLQTKPELPKVKGLIVTAPALVRSDPAEWVPQLNMLPNIRHFELQYPEHIVNMLSSKLLPPPYTALLARPDTRGVASFTIQKRIMLTHGHHNPTEEWVGLAPWLQFFRAHKRLEKVRLEISRGWAFQIHRAQGELRIVAEWNSMAATGTLNALRFALYHLKRDDLKRVHIEQTGVRLPHHAEALARALKGLEGVSSSVLGDGPLDPARP